MTGSNLYRSRTEPTCVNNQGRRSHTIIEEGHKRRLGVWGTEVTQRGRGAEPRLEVWGTKSPSSIEAEAFIVKLHIIFALKYNKQQLLSLESTS